MATEKTESAFGMPQIMNLVVIVGAAVGVIWQAGRIENRFTDSLARLETHVENIDTNIHELKDTVKKNGSELNGVLERLVKLEGLVEAHATSLEILREFHTK